MNYEDMVQLGLDGEEPLKIIMCGRVENDEVENIGVVEVVYVSLDRQKTIRKLKELNSSNPDNYYMVYSVPLDVDLTELEHYPSMAITKEDLEG